MDLNSPKHRNRIETAPAVLPTVFLLLVLCVLLAGIAGGREVIRELSAPGPPEADRTPMVASISRLDRELHGLATFFEESRSIQSEARLLAGLDPLEREQPVPARDRFPAVACVEDEDLARSLAASNLHLERMLTESRSLKESYDRVLSAMREKADLWASIPSINPVAEGQLTSRFGIRTDPFTGFPRRHEGLDLQAPTGTAVHASAYGRVVKAGVYRGYGKLVEIDHGNGLRTRYGHNAILLVHPGERVRRGQVIARVGQTGRASAPHLHYEVLVDGRPVDPSGWVFPGGTLAD